jgi:hypothetical protein
MEASLLKDWVVVRAKPRLPILLTQRPVSSLGGINPFPVAPERNDPVISEFARLGIPNEQPLKTVKRPGTSKRVVPWALTPEESQQLQAEDPRQLYTWLQKRMSAPAWGEKKDDTKRSLIHEERERIASTRFGRVTRMRRKEPVASGE